MFPSGVPPSFSSAGMTGSGPQQQQWPNSQIQTTGDVYTQPPSYGSMDHIDGDSQNRFQYRNAYRGLDQTAGPVDDTKAPSFVNVGHGKWDSYNSGGNFRGEVGGNSYSYGSGGSNSYGYGSQPPSIGDMAKAAVSLTSGDSITYGDNKAPSLSDVNRRPTSQTGESLDEEESVGMSLVGKTKRIAAGSSEGFTSGFSGWKKTPLSLPLPPLWLRLEPPGSSEGFYDPIESPGPEPMEIDVSSTSLSSFIPNSDVTVLEGHISEVYACAWSPAGSLLASRSADFTARIWTIGDGPCSSNSQKGPLNVAVLRHNRFVSTLDWNGEGTLLATGSNDGQARIWSKDGELVSTLTKHEGTIWSLKWNKKGDYLLSGSRDNSAIVWDIKTGEWKQQFEFHADPIIDVDWRNNVSFATCSGDNMIYVCKVGDNRPVKTFAGHQYRVNAIKWDPTGTLLASCSADSTAKIWSLKQDTCLHDLKGHTEWINTIRWSPTGPGTSNPNQPLVLASASLDSTIKLWDVESGRLLHSLHSHRESVQSVAFSPNGKYLVSGSSSGIHIWSVKEAKLVKTFERNGWINDVCWNKEGDKIGSCFSEKVCILDFRM